MFLPVFRIITKYLTFPSIPCSFPPTLASAPALAVALALAVAVALALLPSLFISCISMSEPGAYQGIPYSDSLYTSGAQEIPGKLQCEYYDLGGEGISWHDTDSINEGSGGLNPDNGSYLNSFRKRDGVDISYTKVDERMIDNNPFNFTEPFKDQLYVGWTAPGEWLRYTVKVNKSGYYRLGMMYTSNKDGKISLEVNGKNVTGNITIPSTYVAADSLYWRQWHHWNYIDSLTLIPLERGIQILTLNTVEIGWMNYDYFSFVFEKNP